MPKPKKCRICGNPFSPANRFHVICSQECAITMMNMNRKKAARRETKRLKTELNQDDRSWLTKEADRWFGRFIRARDYHQPCISCGRTNEEVMPSDGWKPGGAWDAGHYRSRGAHPELRFEETNCHKQCKSCNGGSGQFTRKRSTVGAAYDEAIVDRIGQKAVDWLKGPHEPKKHTKEELREIIALYKEKTKKRRIELGI